MAQGKAWDREEVIKVLEPYFKLGCSVTKACKYGGIPQSTVQTWIDNDDELRLQVTAWQNEISAKARANWRAKIASGEYGPSIQWLERSESDDFSTRQEIDHTTGGEQMKPQLSEHDQQQVDKALEMATKAYEAARKLNP